MVMLLGVGIYTLFIWMPTYLTYILAPPISHALIVNTLTMILMIALMPVAGRLTDRLGYKPVLVGAMVTTAIVVYPLFVWIDTGGLTAMVVAMMVFAVVNGFLQGPTPVAMVAQFPVEIRYSAMAVGYNVSMAAVRRHRATHRHLADQHDRQSCRAGMVCCGDCGGKRGRNADPQRRQAVASFRALSVTRTKTVGLPPLLVLRRRL